MFHQSLKSEFRAIMSRLICATALTFLCLLSLNYVVAFPDLSFPNGHDVKENTNLIDGLVAVVQDTDRPLGYEEPADVLIRLILLIMDVFTTASGSYFILPDANSVDDELEQQKVVAKASTDLWMKLPYTIQMEEVFFNASQLTLAPLLSETPSRMERIHNDLFNNIEVQIKANMSLYKVYNHEKHRIEEYDSPRIVEGVIDFRNVVPIYAFRKLITMLRTYPRLQYFLVHAQFASYARGASLMSHVNATVQMNNYAVAQSLVSLASEPKIGPKVQDLYEKALRQTVETVKEQLKSDGDVMDADQILFPEIERVFGSQSDLGVELSRMKESLLLEK